jgi:hypothetical protein
MGESPRRGGGRGFVALLLIAAAAAFWFFGSYHMVTTRDGMRLYKKGAFGFEDTFVNMKEMSVLSLMKHTGLVKSMVSAGDLELVPGGTAIQSMIDAGASVSEAVRDFDREHRISERAGEAVRDLGQKAREIDERYQIRERARDAVRSGGKALEEGSEAISGLLRGIR